MKIFFITFLISSMSAFAFDNPYILRSPRGLLMGDAFTAINDDEYTLFYNPASLARHKHDITFYPLTGYVSGTNILGDLDRFKDFPDEPAAVADVLLDFPAHIGAGTAPGFKLFNFGISFIASESVDVLLRNKAHPMMDIDRRSDRGFAMGVGIPLSSSRISRKTKNGSQTSIGISTKYIKRSGIRDTLSLTGPVVVDALGQEELEDLIKSLGHVEGQGWGFDAGIEHVVRNGPTQMVFGLAALDITGTEFKVPENPNNLKVANNRDQINLGMALGQDFKFFHYIFSADIRGLNEEMDFGKRVRLGFQFGLPGLKLMGGVNSGYYSYGAMLDLPLLKVTAGFYDVEIGHKYQQIKSKRFIVYLSLFDFSFDA